MRQTVSVLLCIVMAAISFGQSARSAAPNEQAADTGRTGTLVVLVAWDDLDTTPTTGAYVEAHRVSEKSFVLKMVKPGRYEAALPPGVYDVFVSEGISTPRCRRALVTAGYTGYWRLMLEHDEVYLDRSGARPRK